MHAHILRSTSRAVALSLLGLALFAASIAGQVLSDVVYLKNGSVVKGTIVEQTPGESILIQTRDGSTWRFTMDEVSRLTKEGGSRPNSPSVGAKNAAAAGALSFLLPGGGQFYNGESDKGLMHLAGMVVAVSTMSSGADDCVYDDNCAAYYVGALSAATIGIYSIVDAVRSARRINAGNGFALSVSPSLERVRAGPNLFDQRAGTRFGVRGKLTW